MVTDDHLKEIGRLTITWSDLLSFIELALWRAAEFRRFGPHITAHMSFPQLSQALSAVINDKFKNDKDFTKQFAGVMKVISGLANDRNNFMHCVWEQKDLYEMSLAETAMKMASFKKVSARGTFKQTTITVTPEDIESITLKMKLAMKSFLEIMRRGGVFPPAQP